MPLYWPKRVLSFETQPAPTLTSLAGFFSAAICSSRSSAQAAVAAASAAAIAVRRSSPPERALIGTVPRVVGAVDVGVAVEAGARQRDADAARIRAVRAAGDAGDVAAVAGRLVALLAEERRARLQQVVVHRAVRVVADRAVLLHRLVGAHERAALLRVAGVAGLVDAIAHQQLLAGGAVRVMAVGARDLAFPDRMAHRTVDLRALLLVAGGAHGRLRHAVAHLVVAGVHLVARGAGDVAA